KWLREHMHESIPNTIRQLNIKLVGHYRYYGIYGNWISLTKFYRYVKGMLWKMKRKRDQSQWLSWKKYNAILKLYPLENPKIHLKSAY
ncbi:MAG: group II intron reverse transcriptase/maturase, partial [Bacillota bacterium]|nr:group II intron reverse transcriptase/maturase [Bacillota bacterium]